MSDGTIIDSYSIGNAAGTGLITKQMVIKDNFIGWNFSGLWQIIENISYPYFVWQGSDNIPYALNVNLSPVAVDDTIEVAANSTNNPINVLVNDSDSDGGILSVTGVTQPTNGTSAYTAYGVTYTPNGDFFGSG